MMAQRANTTALRSVMSMATTKGKVMGRPKIPIVEPKKPGIPLRIGRLSGAEIIEQAPEVLTLSPAFQRLCTDDKKLFWAIYEEMVKSAEGYRTAQELYLLADIQFGLLTEDVTDEERGPKEAEARLKRQRTMFEQMEKIRKDKGEVAAGLEEIKQALVAMKDSNGDVKAWLVEFSPEELKTLDTEGIDDAEDVE